MLFHRLRRWNNIRPAFFQRIVLAWVWIDSTPDYTVFALVKDHGGINMRNLKCMQ